jgi:hypothetical protein
MYLQNQQIYRSLMAQFIRGSSSADEFMERFMEQWRLDRDAQWEQLNTGMVTVPAELEFGEILDQLFTACDCYTPTPNNSFEISAAEFKTEVAELYFRRWQD